MKRNLSKAGDRRGSINFRALMKGEKCSPASTCDKTVQLNPGEEADNPKLQQFSGSSLGMFIASKPETNFG